MLPQIFFFLLRRGGFPLLGFGLVVCAHPFLEAESELPLGSPIVQLYSPKEYNAHVRNHGIARDSKGVLYFANDQGVVEYDGVAWQRLLPDEIAQAYSLAVDSQDRVFVGGFDEIGYLEPGEDGAFRFERLTQLIPEPYRGDQIYRRAHALGDRVVFTTAKALYLWDAARGSIAVTPGLDVVSEVFSLKGEIYVTSAAGPVRRLAEAAWEVVPGAKDLLPPGQGFRRVAVSKDGERAYLVSTGAGIYSFDGERFEVFSQDPRFVDQQVLARSALALDSGRLAVGTSRHGVFVFDRDGTLLQRVGRQQGLSDQRVGAMLEDAHGAVWMLQGKGISRVQLVDAISCYAEESGLEGGVHFIARHAGRLYVATTTGLYVGAPDESGLHLRFLPVEGLPECKSIVSTELGLLVGGMTSLYRVDGNSAEILVPDMDASYMHRLRSQPNLLLVAAYPGFWLLEKREDRWEARSERAALGKPVHGIAEADNGDLWLKSGTGIVRRLRLDGDTMGIREYTVADGLPRSWVSPLSVEGEMTFTSSQGKLYRLDEASDRFVEDDRYQYFPGEGAHGFLDYLVDQSGREWVSRGPGQGDMIPKPPGDYILGMQHLSAMVDPRASAALVEEDGSLWIGTPDGIIRYEGDFASDKAAPPFNFSVRRIESSESGRALYGDRMRQPPSVLRLPDAERSVRVQIAAFGRMPAEGARFRYHLEGYDRSLPAYESALSKHYVNLPPGEYTLRISSRDPLGRPGQSFAMPLYVQAPFFLTWPAYALYILSGAGIVYALSRYRTRTLIRANRNLRELVELRTAELARQSLALEERNAELEGRNEELRDLAGKAAEAAEAKTRFLAMMSHEIRTPMNGVMGMCALLGKTGLSGEQLEFLGSIKSSGDSLLNIIDDILDYTKIEEGKLELESIPFDIVECVESVSSLLGPQANEKGLDIRLAIDPAMQRMRVGDPTRIRQILVNLIGNAIKFTERGGVTVSLIPVLEGNACRIEVADTGIGIEPGKIDSIFEPFFQADVSNARRFGGTGLGLSICKQIVDRMRGRISLSSEVGSGTRFMVELPCPVAVEGFGAWESGSLKGKRVILYCSDPLSAENLSPYLEHWGMEIRSRDAASLFLPGCGAEGEFAADATLIEHKLSSFASAELARCLLAAQPETRRMPIILLVDRRTEALRDEMERDPDLYALTKPIVPSRLLKLLTVALRSGAAASAASEVGSASSDDDFSDLKTLVAEDNPLNQEVAVRLLESLGVEVALARNGCEAIDAYQQDCYDLILMDVQMPKMDGIEAARRILAASEDARKPLVYGLSAGVLQEERLKCSEVGMQGFIRKPFELDDLREALRAARERRAGPEAVESRPAIVEIEAVQGTERTGFD